MPRIKKGWKVLIGRDREMTHKEGFSSLFRNSKNGGTNYCENKWTNPLPGCGPLTVIKARRAARYLAKHANRTCYIRRCLYVPSEFDSVWAKVIDYSGFYKKNFAHITTEKTVKDLEKQNTSILIPGQTVLASQVMILPEKSHHKKCVM